MPPSSSKDELEELRQRMELIEQILRDLLQRVYRLETHLPLEEPRATMRDTAPREVTHSSESRPTASRERAEPTEPAQPTPPAQPAPPRPAAQPEQQPPTVRTLPPQPPQPAPSLPS